MKGRKKIIWAGALLCIALIIKVYSLNSFRVEAGYSHVFYPRLSLVLRWFFGWLPFSLGDLLYGGVILWLGWRLVKFLKKLAGRQLTLAGTLKNGYGLLTGFLLLYIVFNLLWGINYNRVGIARQLDLKMEKYSRADLEQINSLLLEKVNAAKTALLRKNEPYPANTVLFNKVQAAYQRCDSLYPFLHYRPPSLKSSLWGWAGNYLGFTGYYNPFTGEAQVNTTVPKFLQPYVGCHEVAHQLGYAREMEANFVGYLAARSSADTIFQYSVYLDVFIYSNRNLFIVDSSAARQYAARLLPEIKQDLQEWRRFNLRHRNPIEPVFRWLYGKYLQSNEQPQGVLAYDEVTGFLIAFYKKFGYI